MIKNKGKWIIESLTIKCPKCGRETTSEGEDAKSLLEASSVECLNCGFSGETNPI
jgi:predicted RNA-binding Zn-ribbon protein involved in translation (DUF1610 family)